MNRQATIERLQTLLQRVQERALVARVSNARQLVDARGDAPQTTRQPIAIGTPLRESAAAQPLPVIHAKHATAPGDTVEKVDKFDTAATADKTAAPQALVESPALAPSSTDQVDPDSWNLALASRSDPDRVPVKTAADAVAQPPSQVSAKQSRPPDGAVIDATIPAANATADASEPLISKTAVQQPPLAVDTSDPDAPSSEQGSLTKLGELLAAVAVRSEPVEDLQVASNLTSSRDPLPPPAPSPQASAKAAVTMPGFSAVEEIDETASASTNAQAVVVRPPDLLKDQIVAATVEAKAESHHHDESEQVTKRTGSPVPHDVSALHDVSAPLEASAPVEDETPLVAATDADKAVSRPPEQTECELPVETPPATQDARPVVATATETTRAEPPSTRNTRDSSKLHVAPPVESSPVTQDARSVVAATQDAQPVVVAATEVVPEEPPSTRDVRQALRPDIAAASESVTPEANATQKTTKTDEVTVEQQTKPVAVTTAESDAAAAASIAHGQVPVEIHIAGIVVSTPAMDQSRIAVFKRLAQPAKAITFAQAVHRSLTLGRPSRP